MIELSLIGIGAGSPDHLTAEGRRALQDAALILAPRKPEAGDLDALRRHMIAEAGATARIARFDMPVRDPSLPYLDRVNAWHDEIARRWQAAIDAAGPLDGPVALLVWGDPSLYDSTLRIAERLSPAPALRVIPGITALQALTAAHQIPFNTLGGEVTVTTGRRLADHGWPEGAETLAVMLDGKCSFTGLDPRGLHIWWGAYLGMKAQILDTGPLAEAGPRIEIARAKARAENGWIMDCYLLRRADQALLRRPSSSA
jgi:precorrin-6A synthase